MWICRTVMRQAPRPLHRPTALRVDQIEGKIHRGIGKISKVLARRLQKIRAPTVFALDAMEQIENIDPNAERSGTLTCCKSYPQCVHRLSSKVRMHGFERRVGMIAVLASFVFVGAGVAAVIAIGTSVTGQMGAIRALLRDARALQQDRVYLVRMTGAATAPSPFASPMVRLRRMPQRMVRVAADRQIGAPNPRAAA